MLQLIPQIMYEQLPERKAFQQSGVSSEWRCQLNYMNSDSLQST